MQQPQKHPNSIEGSMTCYSLEPINALVRMPDVAAAARYLPVLIDQQYEFYSPDLRQTALDLISGAVVAASLGLDRQITHYMNKAREVIAEDMATRVKAIVANQTGYQGFTYHHPHHRAAPRSSFDIKEGSHCRWSYQYIQDVGQMLPPHALQTLFMVRRAGIAPDAFWIADKKKPTSSSEWYTVGSVLCVQFSRVFVAISQWESQHDINDTSAYY